MTKRKNDNLNIEEKEATKIIIPGFDDYYCTFDFKMKPIPLSKIEEMAKEMREFPKKNPKAKFLSDFYRSKGISQKSFDQLSSKHECLREARELYLQHVGERMQGNAVDGKAHWPAIKHSLWRYNKDFEDDDKHAAEMKSMVQDEVNKAIATVFNITNKNGSEEK